MLLAVVGIVGLVVGAYAMVTIPAPHPEVVMQSTVFLDAHGQYIGRRGPVDRQDVPLSRVPGFVQDAVIAAENRTFRTDTGINPSSIARALFAAVTGGEHQGGSTITQQYIKNALLTPQQSLSRKLREALIAVKLDQTRSKDDILAGYLNTVYFGRGAAGIQAAARNYFGVDVDQLTVSQGAALAAIINLPSYYERAGADPAVTAVLEQRWSWVLDGMVTDHALTPAQRAQAVFPAFRFYPPGPTDDGRQYLLDVAAAEAADHLGITQDELASGGYTVHTTFDLTLQDTLARTVQTDTPTPGHHISAQLHAGVAALTPGTGAVRALYGGADYAHQPFDDATEAAIETGTALDPLQGAHLAAPLDRLSQATTLSPLQMAAAYATVATHGRYTTPYTVDSITRNGQTLYTTHPHPNRTLSDTAARAITNQLATPAPHGPPALATGHAGDRTAWATGYSRHLVITVALFPEHPTTSKKPQAPATLHGLTGSTTPTALATRITADIWPPTA